MYMEEYLKAMRQGQKEAKAAAPTAYASPQIQHETIPRPEAGGLFSFTAHRPSPILSIRGPWRNPKGFDTNP